jgi:hypothetical protein
MTTATLPGELVAYVFCPLLVAAIIGAFVWATKIHNRLNEHGQALALMLHDFNPPGASSLRELVQAHSVQLATIETQLSDRQIPVARLRHREGPES